MKNNELTVVGDAHPTRNHSSRLTGAIYAARQAVVLLAILFVAATLRADDSAEWKLLEEHWYRIEMAGQPAGWMGSFVHERGEHLRSTNSMAMSIERGAVPISMEVNTTQIETREGKPVSIRMRQVMGQEPIETEWRFEEDKVVEVSSQGGRETTREHPHPEGEWLMPRAAKRFALAKMKDDEKEFAFRTVDPSAGLRAINVRYTRTGEDTFKEGEREIPVTVWRMNNDIMGPLHATEHYDAEGRLVYSATNIGIGILTMRRVNRGEAQEAQGAAAPEMLFQSFVVPDKPIKNVMRTRQLSMRLRTREGEMPELPSAGSQRFTMEEGGRSALVVVDIDDPLPASEADLKDASYLRSSPLIDSDDEMVKALARRTVREISVHDREDAMKKAEAIRAFTYRYITNKGMDTAFASASETARTRAGDCSEHSVLLAGLLRAEGIPSRVAMGLVYVDEFAGEKGIFGWHMWTQALVDGRWIDLDATLPVQHHAGHIITSVSSLADGLGGDHVSMLVLMGNLEIDILD